MYYIQNKLQQCRVKSNKVTSVGLSEVNEIVTDC
jgi:hypothetical protein